MNTTPRKIAVYGTLVVLAHAAAQALHGVAHVEVGVYAGLLGSLFIGFVITAAPLAAAALLWTRFRRTASALLLVSMAGSLAFGAYNHFLAVSPDHVLHVPGAGEWRSLFQASAILLAVIECAGVFVGAWALDEARRGAASATPGRGVSWV